MSRLWPERLAVSFEAHRLVFAGPSGKRAVEVDPSHGSETWRSALDALRREALSWRARIDVSVILSSRFVRYAVVPQGGGAATPDEELALARFHFARIHGDLANGWDVRLSPDAAGPQLACATDSALIEGLRACFPRASRARLVSVQPYLMAIYNRWRSRVPNEGAWLLLAERDRVCLARVAAKGWGAVQNLNEPAATPSGRTALIQRERRRAGGEPFPTLALVRPPTCPDLLGIEDAPEAMTLAAA